MGQRAYCGQDHPVGDVEADHWCEMYHRVKTPTDRHENRQATEGLSRCDCGCKYWESDRCVDCGQRYRPEHDEEK